MNDLIIVGGGPAGLSAAVNASSEGLKTCVLEASNRLGGQSKYSSLIENYLGFPNGISGYDLAMRSADQATKFGTEIRMESPALHVECSGDGFRVYVDGSDQPCVGKALLVTAGLQWRKLQTPGHDVCGIHYGAIPETARSFRGQRIVVIGAANSAGQATLHFARYAKHITLVCRGAQLSQMSQYLIDRLEHQPNVDVLYNSEVLEVLDQQKQVKKVRLTNGTVNADAVFVFIGSTPESGWLAPLCDVDDRGFLRTGDNCCTRTPGLFAAGDIRAGSIKRVAASVGEGARAIHYIHRYLAGLLEPATVA